MKHPGSILLIVILTLSALILLCTKQLFVASLTMDTVFAKQAQEKKFWLLQGLLECTALMCKNHWGKLQQQLREKKKISLFVPHWPPNGEYRAELHIMQITEKSIKVDVQLYQEQKNMGVQSCVLTTDATTKTTRMSEWSA